LSEGPHAALEWLQRELDRIIASYQSPHERRVGYGNLRHEYSSWKQDGGDTTNVAVIYETPGGSTTQLNVSYDHAKRCFHYLDMNLESNVETTDPREALQVVEHHVRSIPEKRLAQVHKQVETWMEEGKSRSEVFAELNKMFTAAFLGGRVSTSELKAGIQYAVKLKSQS